MTRQFVRFGQVRTPELTNDQYTPAQIQNAEQSSATAEDFLQYVLSQVRLLAGTDSWKTLPTQTVSQLGGSVTQLQDQADVVAQLSQAVTGLSAAVAQGQATYATKDALAQATSALNGQVAGFAGKLQAIQTQITGLVTPQGLALALQTATRFDQPLRGTQDRQNRLFVTPAKYVPATLRVFLNGQRLNPGALGDYVASQSAAGLGYDSVVLSAAQAAPCFKDILTADYIPS